MPLLMHQKAFYIDKTAIRCELLIGLSLLVLGLTGVVDSNPMGMNLSPMHGLFLSFAGVITIWGAASQNLRRAFYISLSLGFTFAILSITGPYFMDFFSRIDHFVHFIFAVVFLYLSLTWKLF